MRRETLVGTALLALSIWYAIATGDVLMAVGFFVVAMLTAGAIMSAFEGTRLADILLGFLFILVLGWLVSTGGDACGSWYQGFDGCE